MPWEVQNGTLFAVGAMFTASAVVAFKRKATTPFKVLFSITARPTCTLVVKTLYIYDTVLNCTWLISSPCALPHLSDSLACVITQPGSIVHTLATAVLATKFDRQLVKAQ
eukprot:5496828-Pyramimonas_sp.AAC.1